MRRVAIVAALGLLLPGLSFAQPNQGGQERQGGRPAAPENRPAPGGPRGPGPAGPPRQVQAAPVGRPPIGRPPAAYRPPMVAQPLPPRGNQFWHRGQYYARIHGPVFRYPPGWGYRRWAIGARLPVLFLAPAYFYGGWAALGLAAAPPGYAWVRYGPDLLEVNLSTGEIDDVIYGVFY